MEEDMTGSDDQALERWRARELRPRCAKRIGEAAAGTAFPCKRPEALCRTRTDDPFLTMEVLYQLS